MKKLLTVLVVLLLAASAIAAAPPEEQEAFTFRNGVVFGMSMEEVIATETVRYHEIDHEHTHGPVSFVEVEYEHVRENDIRADLEYLFENDRLVAIRLGYETRDISYEQLKTELTERYGEAGEVDLELLGNGIYAVDDDGRLEGDPEAIVYGTVMIILELDEDDIDVTYVDLNADYIQMP